jgi:hypothetical protein
MKIIFKSLLSLGLAVGIAVPRVGAAEAKELSLDDLGFQAEQTKSDPAMQARLHKRSRMLKTHQVLGLVTAVPLLATVMTAPEIEGGKTKDIDSETDTHKMLGVASGAMYLTTASFALLAPEGETAGRNKGLTKLHKALAWIHFPAMVAAPILGYQAYKQAENGESIHGSAKYHREVAGVAAGSYLAAMLVMVFNF